MKSAIYIIQCLINDKVYVGSAVNVYSRISTHKANLNLNKHSNKHLQSAYNLYGAENFEFKIVEVVEDKNLLLKKEENWILWLNASNREHGFNKRIKPNSNLGVKNPHSEEWNLKISLSNKGKRNSPEAIERMRMKLTGKKQTFEHIRKAIEGRKEKSGFAHSEISKLKIGMANSKPDIWPHKDKSYCKCRECLDKKNTQRKIRTKNKASMIKQNKIANMIKKGDEIKWLN